MIRVNYIIIPILILISTSIAFASRYDTGWITFTQPNGVKFIARTYGDEYEDYFETHEGFSLEKNFNDGYYYYASGSNSGKFILTKFKVGIDQPIGIPKNLIKKSPFRSRQITDINFSGTGNKPLAKVSANPTIYTLKVLLVEFNDIHGRSKYTCSDFKNMLGGNNYNMSPDGDTAYGSMNQYYQCMSNGKVLIQPTVLNNTSGEDKPIWLRLPYDKSDYYNSLRDIFNDAYNAGVSSGFDMSNDGNKRIAIIYAGNYYGDGLNPAASIFQNDYVTSEVWGGIGHYNDEDSLYTFAHIGIHCHEFGHTLGFWDIYVGNAYDLNWSLYGNGDKNGNTNPSKGQCPAPIDPCQRYNHNWISVLTPSIPNTGVSLSYDKSNPTIYRIESGATAYYFENRRYSGYSRYCPGCQDNLESGGILVWRTYANYAQIISADNLQDELGNFGDLWPGSSGNRYLNDFTTPNCRFNDGSNSNIIMHSVSNPGTTMTAVLGGMWFGSLPFNMTWSGTTIISGDFNIPSGMTLTLSGSTQQMQKGASLIVNGNLIINEGSTQYFQNGASIIINGALTIYGESVQHFQNGSSLNIYGTLTSYGTVSNPVTFDFKSPNDTTNNGIRFYNGSIGSGINHCLIRNADRGIYENGVSLNIDNSEINGCTYGICLYNSSPTIHNNNIHNNYTGVYLISSSSHLDSNYVHNNAYGISCVDNSHPIFGNGSKPGYNTISSNTYGVYCWNNSLPVLGNNSPVIGGHNKIENPSNNGYNLYSLSSGVIYAINNWWGSNVIFNIAYTGSVIYRPYLTNANVDPLHTLSKSANNLYSSGGGNSSLFDLLNNANELIAEKNFNQARSICLNLITNYPDSSVSFNALNLIKETYTVNEIDSCKNIYSSLFNTKAKKDIYALAGLILADFDTENKLSRIQDVFNAYQKEKIVELAIFDQFEYIYFEKQDMDNAREILKELDLQFPKSEGAIEAHRIIRDAEYFQIESLPDQALQKSPDRTPKDYTLYNNYPNPFNGNTNINYFLPKQSHVILKIHDILGREIETLVDEEEIGGSYMAVFNGRQLSSGVYFYTMKVGDFMQTKKLLLLK